MSGVEVHDNTHTAAVRPLGIVYFVPNEASLDQFTDVDLTGAAQGDVLSLDANGQWVPTPQTSGVANPFEHVQLTPAASWIVTHNLAHYPLVMLYDLLGEWIVADIDHGSVNQTTITFAFPVSGRAVFI